MDGSSTYVAPRLAPLRWLASIDPTLPNEVRKRLGAIFFGSPKPFVVGAINAVAVVLLAFYRIGHSVFLAIAAVEVLLLAARLAAMRKPGVRTGPFFAVGLAWALTQAVTIVVVVLSRDIPMTIIVLASSLAAIGSIIGRNFAAPRYAMTQVLLIDLSFKASFGFLYPEFIPLILCQGVMFVLMNISMIEQHRRVTVRAITAEIESRTHSLRDPLTGLLNRRGLEGAFDRLTARGTRPALLYLDLDGFKQVNDTLGHHAGDVVLQQVGQRLTATIGPHAVACRLGGDEFLVLCDDSDAEAIVGLGARLIVSIGTPYQFEPTLLARIGVSIGAARGDPAADLKTMMVLADEALYAAKAAGKSRCILHAGNSETGEGHGPQARRA
ncbi:diguanylate cyclase [Aureimonas sp. AU12]|uniref:GGDEF domain-containing protein n=1 Tax=Aureimonas sp. AU12 TaxID=1638161 RepID=UPI0007831A4F|nr:GGDEF domain-containing protein [Aureimonas sp. AU12]